MAKFFGIYCASGLTQHHDFIINKFKNEDTKVNGGTINEVLEQTLYLASLDYETFGPHAFLQTDSHIATLVGHPLLSANRNNDLNTLNSHYTNAMLTECEGVFCMARYNKVTNVLNLVTDSLGVRPFYYMYYEGAFIFSTQYSLLKNLGLPLTCNHEGMMEYATLGYYLFVASRKSNQV
jgi:asparagine synthase (glutamine-hydrolysing)